MFDILSEYPLLLLFIVASLGYFIGQVKIKGSSLGTAAILFTGLAFGALDPRFNIPEVILFLGLSIFVYSIGLSSGPAFFQSYRKNGMRDFIFVFSMLLFSGILAGVLWLLFDFSAAMITGVYSGSTTNTAALAGVIDMINMKFQGDTAKSLVEEAVVGYSFSYPIGVLGGIIAIVLMERIFKIDYAAEKQSLRKSYPLEENLMSRAFKITNPSIMGISIRDFLQKYDWHLVFGRLYRNGELSLVNWDTTFREGDIFMVVGAENELAEAKPELGDDAMLPLEFNRREFDHRRIFVSNPKVAGRTIASLNIQEKYQAIITRIRRGDIDMLASADTVLELGDRIRFIARREDLDDLSAYFGDSYQESSKVNLFSFGLGIGLGVLLGTIDFNFGGGVHFKLGYAGGPLVVGIILGALRRTGSIVWTLPYSANATLQQIGLMFLLTTIGVRSGHAFIESVSYQGVCLFFAGAIISLVTAFTILFVGYKLLKMPFSLLMGVVANQPAILDFAQSRTKNHIPLFGFAMMFPLALIAKVIIAQVLFLVLN
jgi:putative transport protein